jgi:hypothetical protein
MQPIDLLAYYRENLHDLASGERRDPDFCRIALQLCKDLPQSRPDELSVLELALFCVLKQANWPRKGLMRLLGPVWLSYDMAHSSLGPFRDRDQILQLASSIARTARHYQAQLFGNHSSASYNQRQLKVAILFMCIAIHRGMPHSYFIALPQLGPQA